MKIGLFSEFVKQSPNSVFISVVLGALSGISYSLLIPLVVNSLERESTRFETASSDVHTVLSLEISNYAFAKIFFVLCIFIFLSKTISQVVLARVGLDVTSGLRIKIFEKIADAPISIVERLGGPRLIASLTADVQRIVLGARMLPDIIINCVKLLGMLIFLSYLNSEVFLLVIQCILFGAITYQIPAFIGKRYFKRSREHLDTLHESIRGLIYGAKELKVNQEKRNDYFQRSLLTCEENILKDSKAGHTVTKIAVNYGDLISFFVIGVVSYIFINYHSISNAEMTGVIMTLLYVSAPVAGLLNMFPQLAVSRVSLQKINKLFDDLPSENVSNKKNVLPEWKKMFLQGVTYRYSESEDSFAIGPINLELEKGQITFIVGGNGSGKSTLGKIISQHYFPSEGNIYVDANKINRTNVNGLRKSISAIYSDYYLFDRVFGVDDNDIENKINNYLEMLNLNEKVSYEDGKFNTLSLSDGQKRRLALLISFIENKDVYVFDEWAADQDPIFREVFYCNILKELKSARKLVVVISHDDKYFNKADQLVVMNNGKIEKVLKENQPTVIDMFAQGGFNELNKFHELHKQL